MWMFNVCALRSLRRMHGKKQSDIAEIIGVTAGCVSNYENGISDLSVVQLAKLANYYGVNINNFFIQQKGRKKNVKE